MTRDQAVARIKQGLGFRTDRDDEAILMLQEAQRFYEKGKTLPWFLLVDDQELTLDSSVDTHIVSLPDGFIREPEARRVWFVNDDDEIVVLKKRDFASAFDAYMTEDAGPPEVYALRSSDLYFFPAADDTYTIFFSSYNAAAILENPSDENLWLEHVPELLIGEAGYRLASDMRDQYAMEKVFDPMRKQAWDSVLRETIARAEAALQQSVGSDL